MDAYKRKKNSRMRGSKTHGGGSMKKRRGAGNRGGRGKAGSGKKGGSKVPYFRKMGVKLGKKHFVSKSKIKHKPLNVGDLNKIIESLQSSGKLKTGNKVSLDLTKLGYTKLLGCGFVNVACELIINKASEKAIKKIESAGGKVKTS